MFAEARRAGLGLWILSRLWVVLDDMIDGTVEGHEPHGITRHDLG